MSDLDFSPIIINRLIAHTIHARDVDKELVMPTYSEHLIELKMDLEDLLTDRVLRAIGNKSKGLEVGILDTSSDSFMQLAASMIHTNDNDFIQKSRMLADRLAKAQLTKGLDKSILIIISGEVGSNGTPFLAVIKAETDLGANIVEKNNTLILNVVKDMLLSETQRLYRIGMLVEMVTEPPTETGYLEENFKAYLFDQHLTAINPEKASSYFYGSFLGMTVFNNDKTLTLRFMDETKKFINKLPIDTNAKMKLHEALRVELRSNTKTINILDFAEKHLDEKYKEKYIEKMKKKQIPDRDIMKIKEVIKGKLRAPRIYEMTTDVKVRISVPKDEDIENYVEVDYSNKDKTVMTIKGTIKNES